MSAQNTSREDFEEKSVDIENDGVPALNRNSGSSKIFTNLGYAFLFLLGVGLIVLVNYPQKIKEVKNPIKQEVKNRLPPLVMPAPPEPEQKIIPQEAPIPLKENKDNTPVKMTNGKKELDWTDRKLTGEVLIANKTSEKEKHSATPAVNPNAVPATTLIDPNNKLAAQLIPAVTARSMASQLPDRNYLITKGTTLDCALETAIDSTVPGLTTCRLTRDTYSDNGQVLLLDRGSKLIGEYQGGLKQGQARIFVLWTRAETPNGVIISLDSPGTDALGRSGLEGWIDNHFIERFGAAIMMSLLQGTIEAFVNSTKSGSTINYYDNTASGGEKIVEKILDSSVNIPPTLIKNQGDHIQIMVARDLDFSSVYDLRTN